MTKQELQRIIGRNLARLRAEQNMTQEDVAEKAGISTTHYANLECGNKSTTNLTLCRIADVLGASMDAFMREKHEDSRITVITNLLSSQTDDKIQFVEKLVRLCVSEFPDQPPFPENQSKDSLGVKS